MTDYNKVEQVKNIIQDLLSRMDVSATVEFEESLMKGLVFNISSRESRVLIGHQGATLHSLEIIAHALAARALPQGDPFYFTLDVDDYKRKREYFLKEQARDVAEEVKRTGKSFAMETMPNYERRHVHAYLQENYPDLMTLSEGRDPHRRIVVKLK